MSAPFPCPSPDLLRAIDVHTLLPQQEPFIAIDALTYFDQHTTTTETVVRASSLFVADGVLSAEGLIENIAQTCAVRIGYVNKYILNKGVQIGLIGALRALTICALPPVGALLTTTMTVQEEVFGMILAHAEVVCAGQCVATTEIKIAIAHEE